MAFSDLQMKVASETALQAIYPELVKLQDFAHNYRELEDRPGSAIAVPVFDLSAAAEFNAESNNYAGGENEVNGVLVNLDTHLVKSLEIDDRELAETDIQWAKDAGTAIASVLGRALNSTVFGMMNSTNLPLSASINLSTKAGATALYQVAAENGLDVGDSVVVLNPAQFSKILQHVDFMAYGGTEAIRYGYVPGFVGFKSVVCSTYLPEGVDGVIINRNTVGLASRYLAPGTPGAYPDTWKATDENSGLTIGFRHFMDLAKGKNYLAGEVLFGAKIFYGGNKAVRLIAG